MRPARDELIEALRAAGRGAILDAVRFPDQAADLIRDCWPESADPTAGLGELIDQLDGLVGELRKTVRAVDRGDPDEQRDAVTGVRAPYRAHCSPLCWCQHSTHTPSTARRINRRRGIHEPGSCWCGLTHSPDGAIEFSRSTG
jgi:hypothetical protein